MKLEGKADITMDGMCDGCPYVSLEFGRPIFADGYRHYSVYCVYYKACMRTKEMYSPYMPPMPVEEKENKK